MLATQARRAYLLLLFGILMLTFGSALADVSLQYTLFAKRPTHFRTLVSGYTKTAPDEYAEIHAHATTSGLAIQWYAHPDSLHCVKDEHRAHLDKVAVIAARWVRRLGSFADRPIQLRVYLVPANSAFRLKAPINRKASDSAYIEYGVGLDCLSPVDAISDAAATLVHEAVHVPLLEEGLAVISNEGVAYTMQSCARLEMDGRLPKATLVAHTLPDEMLAPFRAEMPPEYMKRYRGASRASLVGGILAQMNLGLFLGLEPIESEDDPRALSLRQYCHCVLTNTPDFESTKPGAIWLESNGMHCSSQ